MSAPIVIPRPDPLTVLVPVWLAFWGVVGAALYASQPSATTASIPTAAAYVFFGGLVVTSAALLLGMWLRSAHGLQIKLGANVAQGLLCLVYAGWTMQALGLTRSIVFVSLMTTICVACFWQARRLNAVLRQLEE